VVVGKEEEEEKGGEGKLTARAVGPVWLGIGATVVAASFPLSLPPPCVHTRSYVEKREWGRRKRGEGGVKRVAERRKGGNVSPAATDHWQARGAKGSFSPSLTLLSRSFPSRCQKLTREKRKKRERPSLVSNREHASLHIGAIFGRNAYTHPLLPD